MVMCPRFPSPIMSTVSDHAIDTRLRPILPNRGFPRQRRDLAAYRKEPAISDNTGENRRLGLSPRETIFVDIVRDGVRRAYNAAEHVNHRSSYENAPRAYEAWERRAVRYYLRQQSS